MDKFIQYFKDNPNLFYTTVAVLAVCLVLIIVIAIARKTIVRKRQRKAEIEAASNALAQLPHDESQNDLFLNPELNEQTKRENEEAELKKQEAEAQENAQVETENKTDVTVETQENNGENSGEVVDEKTEKVEEKSAYKPENEQNEQTESEKVDEKEQQKVEQPKAKVKAQTKPAQAKSTEEKNAQNKKVQAQKTQNGNDKFRPRRNENTKYQSSVKYSGKWLIFKEDGKFAANLVASNGEVLLRSETYTALSGVKSGIETLKNNIFKNNFAISVDKNGNYFFKLYSSSTRLLCISEGYSSKAVCENAIESVKRFAKTAVIEVKQDEE